MCWRRCGELATDIGRQSEFDCSHELECDSGASLKNQVERSFHGHPRASEARILEDGKQLGSAGLGSQ